MEASPLDASTEAHWLTKPPCALSWGSTVRAPPSPSPRDVFERLITIGGGAGYPCKAGYFGPIFPDG